MIVAVPTWTQVRAGNVSHATITTWQGMYQSYLAPAQARSAANAAAAAGGADASDTGGIFPTANLLPAGGDFWNYLVSQKLASGAHPTGYYFVPIATDGAQYFITRPSSTGAASPDRLGFVANNAGTFTPWAGGFQSAPKYSQDFLENITEAGLVVAGAVAAASAASGAASGGLGSSTGTISNTALSSSDVQSLYGAAGYGGSPVDTTMIAGTDAPVDATGGAVQFQGNATQWDIANDDYGPQDNTQFDSGGTPSDASQPSSPSDNSSTGPSAQNQSSGVPGLQQAQSLAGPLTKALGTLLGGVAAGTVARAPNQSTSNPNLFPWSTPYQSNQQQSLFMLLALGLIALVAFGDNT